MFYWSFVALNKLHPKLVAKNEGKLFSRATSSSAAENELALATTWFFIPICVCLHKVSIRICFIRSWMVYLFPICLSILFSILSMSNYFVRNFLVMLWIITLAILHAAPSSGGELNSFCISRFLAYYVSVIVWMCIRSLLP